MFQKLCFHNQPGKIITIGVRVPPWHSLGSKIIYGGNMQQLCSGRHANETVEALSNCEI